MAEAAPSASTGPPTMPEITGVPKELMSFLQDRFAALEAKMDARFDEIDMSIKALSIRIEDTHKAVRKLRRSVNADDKADKASSSGSLHKASSDPAHPKIRSKHSSSKLSELKVIIPERQDIAGGSDTSSPGTPKISLLQMIEQHHTPEQIAGFHEGAKTIQHYLRTAIEVRKLATMKDMAEERTFVAKELYDTEINYVQTLLAIQTVFMEPLLTAAEIGKPILSKLEIRELFGQINVFYGVNSEFLRVLTPLMTKWNAVTTELGTVFLKNVAQFLKVYGAHIDSYSKQFETVKAIMAKNAEFARFVVEAEKRPECRMQDLAMMFLSIVQRITRYKILLNALQKATWPEHIDYPNLALANEKVAETTMMINEKKREIEGMNRILEIQSMIPNADKLLVAPHRRYITEVEGLWMPKKKKMFLYLFNDSLLVLSIAASDGRYKMKQFCGLEGCRATLDPEPRRLRIDAPMKIYHLDVDDILKKTQFLDHFNTAKNSFREKLSAASTINPRAMFNISDSSHNVSESLLSSYKRRPASVSEGTGDELSSESSSPASSPSLTRGSPSGKLRKSPSTDIRSGSSELRTSPSLPALSSDAKGGSLRIGRSSPKTEKSRTLPRQLTEAHGS